MDHPHPYNFEFDAEIAIGRTGQAPDAIKEIQQLLEPYAGGNVQVWSYHVSHCWLSLRLTKLGIPGNVHLFCGVCFRVMFDPDFEHSTLFISESQDADGLPCYAVQDGMKLHVDCDQLAVKQNVEPIYNAAP